MTCKDCKHFILLTDLPWAYDDEPDGGECRVFPKTETVHIEHWCGQYDKGKFMIEDGLLTVRSTRVLREYGIKSLRELKGWSRKDLERIPECGSKSAVEILDAMEELHI